MTVFDKKLSRVIEYIIKNPDEYNKIVTREINREILEKLFDRELTEEEIQRIEK